MSARSDTLAFKRLLVVFDASSGSRRSLAAVAGLAARLKAELEILFVEDPDLLALCELPAVRLLRQEAAPALGTASAELAAAVAALQRQLQRDAQALAQQHGLAWMFRSARASLQAEIATAAEAADLVILERMGRPFGALRLKTPAFTAAQVVQRPLLVLADGFAVEEGVCVLICGQEEDRAIAIGAGIAAAGGGFLQVRLLPPTPRDRPALEAHVRNVLARLAPEIRRSLTVVEDELPAAVRAVGSGLLVLDWGNPLLAEHDGWKLAGDARCSLLIVR